MPPTETISDMELKVKFFSELTTRELYEIVRARTKIFLLEQGIVCQDFDGVDYDALHCFLEDEGEVLAYLRAYLVDTDMVKIGRVLSVTHGVGHGTRLMKEALPAIRDKMQASTITINAQSHAKGFYERFGFVVASQEFLEENIPHVTMVLDGNEGDTI